MYDLKDVNKGQKPQDAEKYKNDKETSAIQALSVLQNRTDELDLSVADLVAGALGRRKNKYLEPAFYALEK